MIQKLQSLLLGEYFVFSVLVWKLLKMKTLKIIYIFDEFKNMNGVEELKKFHDRDDHFIFGFASKWVEYFTEKESL